MSIRTPACVVFDNNLASTADFSVTFPVVSGTVYKIAIITFGPPDGSSFCIDAVETLCLPPSASVIGSPIDFTDCPTTVDYTFSIDDLMDSDFLTISAEDGIGNPAGTGGIANSAGVFTITDIPVPLSNWTIKIAHENNPACDIELGPFELACPPENDDLCDAIEIIVGASFIEGNNDSADPENMEPEGSCWIGSGDLNSVWYSFVAPASGAVTISTDFANTSLHDTHIAVYSLTDCSDMTSLTEIGCDEDGGTSGPSGNTSVVHLYQLTSGTSYYIQVDGKSSLTGDSG